MKYQFSNTEFTYELEGEKTITVAVCDACGLEHRNNYGFEISYARRGLSGGGRRKFCGKCATKHIGYLEEAIAKSWEEMRAPSIPYSLTGNKKEPVQGPKG